MDTWNTLLFVCAICEREVRDYAFRVGRDRHLAPVCKLCEHMWTEGTGRPKDGSMMDRRKAMQIIALSNALHNSAALREYEAKHGRA